MSTTTQSWRLPVVAAFLFVLTLLLLWMTQCYRPPKSNRPLRVTVKHRERHTAKARQDPPGVVPIMVAFVPDRGMPADGWRLDAKIPLDEVPVWLKREGVPFTIDQRFGTMAVNVPTPRRLEASAGTIARNRAGAFVVRGTSRQEDLPAVVKTFENQPGYAGIFYDPPIVSDADPQICPQPANGWATEVIDSTMQTYIKHPKNVLLAIVDTGFSRDLLLASAWDVTFEPSLSFSPDPAGNVPLSYPGEEHGNMCAYDATLIGDHAKLIDLRTGNPLTQRLSDAEAALNFLYAQLVSNPGLKTQYQGLVISNSWGLNAPDSNLPPTQRYFDNPNHPFTVLVKNLIAEGADVVFAAGNSAECPPTSTSGTIWGANSLDQAISVASVDLDKVRVLSSSQGPGALASNKPDVSAFSNFTGSDDWDQDTGTSASAAVVAGVVAAIRSLTGWSWTAKTPAQVKQHLIDTSDRAVRQGGALITLTGWSRDYGFGVALLK